MMSNTEEFTVLGYKVRFSPAVGEEAANPKEVLAALESQADEITKQSPHLDKGQVLLLVALKLASENHILKSEYREDIEKLRLPVEEALRMVEDIMPVVTS